MEARKNNQNRVEIKRALGTARRAVWMDGELATVVGFKLCVRSFHGEETQEEHTDYNGHNHKATSQGLSVTSLAISCASYVD